MVGLAAVVVVLGLTAPGAAGAVVSARASAGTGALTGLGTDPWHLVPGPVGWHAVDLGDARIWVPAGWSVVTADTTSCGLGQGLVRVGTTHGSGTCPSALTPEPTVALTALSGPVPTGRRTTVHGIGLVRSGGSGAPGATVWDVPALGVQFVLNGPVPPRVLDSLGPSPRGTVLAPGPLLRAPAGWKLVSYRGVQARVPAWWPVVDSVHAGSCGQPFIRASTVYVGPDRSAAMSCPAPIDPAARPGVDGLWLQPGDDSTPGGTTVRLPDGTYVRVGSDEFTDAVVVLAVHGVSAWVGVGADPAVARAVVDSLRVAAGAPDTAVADRCPGGSTAMPTPVRAAHILTLDAGDDTLAPPLPADQPHVPATTVWTAFVRSGGAGAGERTRLVLARYTGRFPAVLQPNGATVPVNDDVLAWVVLTTPVVTPAGPCGLWGLVAYDATSGSELVRSDYSPGP